MLLTSPRGQTDTADKEVNERGGFVANMGRGARKSR